MHNAVVFGGAGFIGRAICTALTEDGWDVIAADGLLDRTTCDPIRASAIPGVRLVECITDAQPDLVGQLIKDAGLVVDAMGWTRHLDAMTSPLLDLRLNVASHLPLIQAWARLGKDKPRVIFLGSSHQYGKGAGVEITEDSKAVPHDVQGVHKLAAEHHWRIAAESNSGQSVISLRFGNTFGPGMPFGEGDLGLIGGFFSLAGRAERIAVFGTGRRRNIVYSKDLARVICALSIEKLADGFHPFNVTGHDVEVATLARSIVRIVGMGEIIDEPMPDNIRMIEIKDAKLSSAKLRALLGEMPPTDLDVSLRETAAAMFDYSGDRI